ncbi:MAG TPA: hypothetical protein VHX15_01255 [Frankiaceae bacterium]|nr:hypothetical protein [Frankiaceae bacterium]
MEQQSGAPGSAQAQASRTVLPGEPFDPPQAAQVPGPRAEAPAEATLAPPAWNYEQPAPPQGAPVYGAAPATYVDPQQFGDGDFNSLHDFATLPAAAQFSAPAPATEAFAPAAYPPPPAEAPAWQPTAQPQPGFPPPVFAPADSAALPPLPPEQDDQGLLAEPGKRRTGRKGPDKRLLAVALVAVLAGGGYFGYTQLSKKSSSTTANTPIVPVTAPAPKYDFPSNIAGLKLQPAASSAALRASVLADAKKWNATAAKTLSFASYASGHPGIVAFSFHPGTAKLAADYASLVTFSAKPDAGNVAVAPHVAQPGAAGGQMTCGGQSGPDAASWCAWRGASTIGVLVVEGSPKTQITEILTREMRAYAEH